MLREPLHTDDAIDVLEALLTAADEAQEHGYKVRQCYFPFRKAYQRALDAMGAYD